MPNSIDTAARAWHALPPEEVLDALGTSTSGLDREDAAQRLERFGPNRLPPATRKSALQRVLAQFQNILIHILLVAAVVTALLGEWIDSGVILAVVILNAAIGFVQESRAEQALESIRNLLSLEAAVVRSGRRRVVPAEELVPGDVVVLRQGDKVPADVRVLGTRELRVDEAMLTGESVPVTKAPAGVPEETPLAERTSFAYSGTLVAAGEGKGVVVATGEATEIGKISTMLAEVEPLQTPLLRKIEAFGRTLASIILGLSALTFLFGFLLRGYTAEDMFMVAVALAVAAIPEGLPAILTITLAIGVQRMAGRKAIIRHLPAVETLGSVTVICSDKTGTLTRNEMTAQTVVTPSGQFRISGAGYEPDGRFTIDDREVDPADHADLLEALRAGVLCNDAGLVQDGRHWRIEGDPTEGALLVAGRKAGLEAEALAREAPRADAIPFTSEQRYMATAHEAADGQVLYVKGAPERVLGMCRGRWTPDGTEDGNGFDVAEWGTRADALAAEGQRVLAVARASRARDGQIESSEVEQDLLFLGLFGLMDPPRPEAIEAIEHCQDAGIRVKMITGDHAKTALAIATQMGIGDGERAMTGAELDRGDLGALTDLAVTIDVFARVAPEHKLRLVEALQGAGQIAAMTGDGVNDAPALKRADIGVAMGIKGTEAAKEASSMVLADDNFASIAAAVEEGRTVYDNIRKALLFILPTNGGEALVVLGAVMLGRTLPLSPVQILWVNMITAVTLALALAFEAPEPDVMNRPPRSPREPILTRFFIWRILFVSLVIFAGTFGLFTWARAEGMALDVARTVALNTIVCFEIFYLFNSRHIVAPVLNREGLFGSRKVLGAVGLVVVAQMLLTYWAPLQRLFGTAALGTAEWLVILPVAVSVLFIVEIEKYVLRRRGMKSG
jgi:magnesium-transporting ATPase (P-type)